MTKPKWYSPQLSRETVFRLYVLAKKQTDREPKSQTHSCDGCLTKNRQSRFGSLTSNASEDEASNIRLSPDQGLGLTPVEVFLTRASATVGVMYSYRPSGCSVIGATRRGPMNGLCRQFYEYL
jgi:hypothetical protein